MTQSGTDLFVQREIGIWNQVQAEAGFEARALAALTRYKSWSKYEVMLLARDTRADGQRGDIHMMFNLGVSTAFK